MKRTPTQRQQVSLARIWRVLHREIRQCNGTNSNHTGLLKMMVGKVETAMRYNALQIRDTYIPGGIYPAQRPANRCPARW